MVIGGEGPGHVTSGCPPRLFCLLIQLIQVYRGHEHDVDSRGLAWTVMFLQPRHMCVEMQLISEVHLHLAAVPA